MLDKLRKAREEESGFTLIELLIVIVILGILAGIVVFAVGGISDRGTASACKSDKKNVEVAAEAYYAKNGAYAAAIGDLVPLYLREAPAGTGYAIWYSGTAQAAGALGTGSPALTAGQVAATGTC